MIEMISKAWFVSRFKRHYTVLLHDNEHAHGPKKPLSELHKKVMTMFDFVIRRAVDEKRQYPRIQTTNVVKKIIPGGDRAFLSPPQNK